MAEETTIKSNNDENVDESNITGNNDESGSSEPEQPSEDVFIDEDTEDVTANDDLVDETMEGLLNDEGEDDDTAEDDEADEEEDEDALIEEKQAEESSTSKEKRGPLEYDIKDMYPELELLVQNKKKDWNFNDPKIIRALWLETKTHAVADWKEKYSRVSRQKDPEIPVQLNHAAQLRNEFRQMEKEKEEIEIAGIPVGRDAPIFSEIKLPTTSTAQMRYKLNRDNPPVPGYFVHHYVQYKKPPFIKSLMLGKRCAP